MTFLRTPDERFVNLPEFPFNPNYVMINGARVHYLDEGAGEIILCLHGEPTWSFLYRKIIKQLKTNYRLVAPDFIGFGRSDKFESMDSYSYKMHYQTLNNLIEKLELTKITLVCQDWGGLLGLPFAANNPEKFSRLVIMNTGLPTGRSHPSEAFSNWRTFVETTPDLPISTIIEMGVANKDCLTNDILRAYEAPFPDASYKAGARKWPLLVPIKLEDPVSPILRIAREKLKLWTKPTLIMFSDKDPITKGADQFFRKLIPSAVDQPEVVIRNAGHFLQEEKGEEIADYIRTFIQKSS